MSKPWIIIGAGGHAKVVLSLLKANQQEILGFVAKDAGQEVASHLCNYPILGDDDVIEQYACDEIHLANGIGSVSVTTKRQAVYEKFSAMGYNFPYLVHPSAVLTEDVDIGHGTQVMAGVVIQPSVKLGENTIVNTSASIDHDCRIGSNCHIAPGAVLSGTVNIGDQVHIGSGATVIQSITIGKNSLVAAGAVVIESIPDGKFVAGVPAKLIKRKL